MRVLSDASTAGLQQDIALTLKNAVPYPVTTSWTTSQASGCGWRSSRPGWTILSCTGCCTNLRTAAARPCRRPSTWPSMTGRPQSRACAATWRARSGTCESESARRRPRRAVQLVLYSPTARNFFISFFYTAHAVNNCGGGGTAGTRTAGARGAGGPRTAAPVDGVPETPVETAPRHRPHTPHTAHAHAPRAPRCMRCAHAMMSMGCVKDARVIRHYRFPQETLRTSHRHTKLQYTRYTHCCFAAQTKHHASWGGGMSSSSFCFLDFRLSVLLSFDFKASLALSAL